jgi:hypothetical protein
LIRLEITSCFSTVGSAKTRSWTRDTTAGFNTHFPEKLKYYVLKNPTSTTAKPVPQNVNYRTLKTVKVGTKTYAIDTNIYEAMVASLAANPVQTMLQLRERIVFIRAQLGIPPPISVQLKDVPLRNYIKTTQYSSVGDEWKRGKTDQKAVIGSFFKFGNKVSSLFLNNLQNLPYINFWSDKFVKRTLSLKNAQYFYAQSNDGCGYSRNYADLFTTAVQSGSTVLPSTTFTRFRQSGIIDYDPFPGASQTSLSLTLAFLLADSQSIKITQFPVKFGAIFLATNVWSDLILDSFGNPLQPLQSQIKSEVQANSELIFIPLLSELEIIDDLNFAPETGFYFPVTNGGDLNVKMDTLLTKLRNVFADNALLQTVNASFDTTLEQN